MINVKMLELNYDAESDILYVTFRRTRKAMSQSLCDHIVIRFDPHTLEAIGLTIIDFSTMTPRSDGSTPQLAFDHIGDLPDDRRSKVLEVVSRPPMNRWLRVQASPDEPGVWYGSILQPQTILDLLRAA